MYRLRRRVLRQAVINSCRWEVAVERLRERYPSCESRGSTSRPFANRNTSTEDAQGGRTGTEDIQIGWITIDNPA
jgi:hypothetical protein